MAHFSIDNCSVVCEVLNQTENAELNHEIRLSVFRECFFVTSFFIIKDKIRNMRLAGLERSGEFSVENLSFKLLRRNGYLNKLYDIGRKEVIYDLENSVV